MGLMFKTASQEIELTVRGYECPILTRSYWDNNWLVLSCRSTTGDKTICGELPCFMTTELCDLQIRLKQFQNGVISSVSWNGTEPNLVITLNENRVLSIFFYGENEDDSVVFSKHASPRDVRRFIDFCEDCLSSYPIREFGIK